MAAFNYILRVTNNTITLLITTLLLIMWLRKFQNHASCSFKFFLIYIYL